MSSSNAFIYIAIAGAAIFTVFSLVRARSLPLLAEVFEVMLSLTAAYSGVVLCVDIINGVKKLGDYGDQRLTIVLGGIAVIWVALVTLIKLIKGINARAAFPSVVPSETASR